MRGSLNLDLERLDEDYIEAASTAKCPSCGFVVRLETLVIQDGVWRFGPEN